MKYLPNWALRLLIWPFASITQTDEEISIRLRWKWMATEENLQSLVDILEHR